MRSVELGRIRSMPYSYLVLFFNRVSSSLAIAILLSDRSNNMVDVIGALRKRSDTHREMMHAIELIVWCPKK